MPCVPSLGDGSSPMDVWEPSKGTQGQETPQGPGDTSALLGSGGCWNYAVRCPRTMTYYQISGVLSSPGQPNAEGPVYPSLSQLLTAVLYKGLVASNTEGEKCLGL